MRTTIIKIMKMAGYDFIKEEPASRLLFYDTYSEVEVQVWLKGDNDTDLKYVINLIKDRSYINGLWQGAENIRNAIRTTIGIK